MRSIIQYLTADGSSANTDASTPGAGHVPDSLEQCARYMAEQICAGFQFHDRDQRTEAIDAFYTVDRNQFAHLDDDSAYQAARAYTDALWAKDNIEKPHILEGKIDATSMESQNWDPVLTPLTERATIVGMPDAYAEETTRAWRNHKIGDDYWTPILRAQVLEYRAALGDPDYPNKPKEGLAGFGPEPLRYAMGVELHDLHSPERWEEAIQVMVPYYRRILGAHERRE